MISVLKKFNKIDIEKIDGMIVASVVPNLITIFHFLGKKYFNIEPMIVNSELKNLLLLLQILIQLVLVLIE